MSAETVSAPFTPDFKTSDDLPADYNDLPEAGRKRLMDERVRLLHVHPQDQWHSDAAIVGNRNGLTVLRDAIDAALKEGKSSTHAMVADGEGYRVEVELEDHAWEHKAWTVRPLPYADPTARGEPDPRFEIQRLQHALRKANAELVKRGVRPIGEDGNVV